MKFWWDNKLVDLDKLKSSKNLREFHDRITAKIMGYKNSKELFDEFKISPHEI